MDPYALTAALRCTATRAPTLRTEAWQSRSFDPDWSSAAKCFPLLANGAADNMKKLPMRVAATHKRPSSAFTCCTWHRDNRRILAGSSSGEVLILQSSTMDSVEDVKRVPRASGGVTCMSWLPSGDCLVIGDHSGNLHLVLQNLAFVGLVSTGARVSHAAVSPCSSKVAELSVDALPAIYDLATLTQERSLEGCGYDVSVLDWHPRAALVVTGSKSEKIAFWDPRDAHEVATLMVHKGSLACATFSKSHPHLLASSARDQLVKVSDIRMMRVLVEYSIEDPAQQQHHSSGGGEVATVRPTALTWGIRGGQLVTADSAGTVSFYNANAPWLHSGLRQDSHLVRRVPHVHGGLVQGLSVHPFGHAMVSCSSTDGRLLLWEA